MPHSSDSLFFDGLPNAAVIWQFASKNAMDALTARHDYLATLREYLGSAIDEDAAEIIFSELVANVVRHAPGAITIALGVDGSTAVLKVADTGPGFAFEPALPPNPYSESGRGLFIVSRYARDVCVTSPDGTGSSIAATLPLTQQG